MNNNNFNSIDVSASGSGREARNLAEKHRRDKLNASIHELSTMVPHVADSSRRMDKTAVLRFAAHGLRLRHVFGKSSKKLASKKVSTDARPNAELTDTLMQLLDSFFITLTCHGQIILISPSIEQLLGHSQGDLYGQNLLSFTHPDDQALLKQQLIPHDLETLFHEDFLVQSANVGKCEVGDSVEEECIRPPSPRTLAHQAYIDERLREDRRCFTLRMARAAPRADAPRSYEIVKIDGCFRRSDNTRSSGNYPIMSQLIRRARGNHIQHDAIAQAALHGISGNDIVLVGMGRILRPSKALCSKHITSKLEYKTRHLIDGRIVDCDQRIGVVAGYMKDEVNNLSPFSFMHQDDVRWVIVALRQMYDCNNDYGESCYRLLSRNGHFIYLQTKGYMEIDKETNKVQSFVCVNTLLSEEDGKRKVLEMKHKFSTIINTKIPSSSSDVPASQNPQQLEKIVLCLIENLQKADEIDGEFTSPAFVEQPRYTRTPPMALVPPETASVKHSISESVQVVSSTAARNLMHNQKSPSSHRSDQSPASSTEENNKAEKNKSESTAQERQQRPTVLKLSGQKPPDTKTTNSANIIYNSKETQTPQPTNLSNQNATPPTKTVVTNNNNCNQNPTTQILQQQISVLKRLHTSSSTITSATEVSSDIFSPAKRTANITQLRAPTTNAEIHNVLTTSLQKLDHSLYTIGNDTNALFDQHEHLKPHVPHAINEKLDKIIIEQKKQKKILVNIKSEYDVHTVQQQDAVSSIRFSRVAPTSITATHTSPVNSVIISNNNNRKITMLTQRKSS